MSVFVRGGYTWRNVNSKYGATQYRTISALGPPDPHLCNKLGFQSRSRSKFDIAFSKSADGPVAQITGRPVIRESDLMTWAALGVPYFLDRSVNSFPF